VGSERNIKEGANANTKPHTNAEQKIPDPFRKRPYYSMERTMSPSKIVFRFNLHHPDYAGVGAGVGTKDHGR
jgi:hypothetical protein